ncbi:hypothetical protein [Streptomyces echinatus]|uniref:hypothetical protein n=1 Tax=Streptomyces echinatus TaxID=67293 RepID=UPI00382A8A66
MTFTAGREAFHADTRITGERLHAEIKAIAAETRWGLGGCHVGRLAGVGPTADAACAPAGSFLCPCNHKPLRRTVDGVWQAHWILEIHLVDEDRDFGGSYTGLLNLA